MSNNIKNYKKPSLENKTNFIKNTNEKKLWNPKWFIIISIIFSFLPSLLLYSINYGRLGMAKRRAKALLNGIILFVVIVFLILMNIIPYSLYILLYVGCNVGLGSYMNRSQSELYKMHVKAGGKTASFLIPVIICFIIILGLIAAMIYSINVPFTKMDFHGDELYYTKNVNKDEVKKLGNYLYDNSFFKDDKITMAVKIDKISKAYIFSFPANREALKESKIIEYSKILSHNLSRDVFNGQKVKINLCDEAFNALKTVE
jgi:hypothetical protein